MRPLNSTNIAAARPIKAPPARAVQGAKSFQAIVISVFLGAVDLQNAMSISNKWTPGSAGSGVRLCVGALKTWVFACTLGRDAQAP
jgi:hypothetical protein